MRKNQLWKSPIALLGALVLVVGGCSGGSSPSPAEQATAAPTTEATAAPTAPAATATAAAPSAVADLCTDPGKAAPGTSLTFASSGGTYQIAERNAWWTPYSQARGITFQESETSDYASIKTQVEANQVTWDVAVVGNDFGLDNATSEALLEPLDYSIINKDEILPGFAGKYRIPQIIWASVLAYRTDKVGNQVPANWADFFDVTKFPGKRGVWDYAPGGILEIALMADGVAPKDLYPLDVPRAIKKLDSIKDQLVFWDSGAKSVELMESGELAMSMMFNGRAYIAANTDKKPIAVQWDQMLLNADYDVVLKGDPNKDESMRYIAWMECAQNNSNMSNFITYGPTNVNSKPNPSVVPNLPTSHVNDTTAGFNDQWWADNTQSATDAYNAWKTQ